MNNKNNAINENNKIIIDILKYQTIIHFIVVIFTILKDCVIDVKKFFILTYMTILLAINSIQNSKI